MEQLISMALMAGVLLSLIGVIGSGSAGVVNGRERIVATSLAKQAMERLQGSAYATVVMNLTSPGLSADPRVSGVAPTLTFEGEQLVGGGTSPYQSVTTASGTAFTISTFISAVTPATGLPYRRITVFVDWVASLSGKRTLRFSSLIYPVDYTSFPAGAGTAEVRGANVVISGTFGADQFTDTHFNAPSARSSSSSANARTAEATSNSATSVVGVTTGPLTTLGCALSDSQNAVCPVTTLSRIADNDSSTTAPPSQGGPTVPYSSGTVQTPGGLTLTTPAGSADAKAAVDACSTCGFGDGDALPWTSASSLSSTTSAATFTNGPGGLSGSLWQMASGWGASTTVDHDSTSGGTVNASAQLTAPAVKAFSLTGAGTFDAAVRVSAFSASATANVTPTLPTTTVTAPTATVDLWDDTVGGYRTVSVVPGVATDVSATGTVTVGGDVITLNSRVQSQPKTTSSSNSSTGTAAAAQQPSLLIVTVQATIVGPHAGNVTVTLDYGQVTARTTWRTS